MNVSEWISEPDAMRRLNLGDRAVRLLAAQGKLRKQLRARLGKKAEPVYHPEDIAREQAKRADPFAPLKTRRAHP